MKPHIVLVVAAFIFGLSSHAATVDCQVYKLIGDPPTANEIIRLSDAKLLEPTYSFSVPIQNDGSFEFKNEKTVSYPTKFSASSGSPSDFTSRLTGISFSGSSLLHNGVYTLDFQFSSTLRKADVIYPHISGSGMPQPIFELRSIRTSHSVLADEWTLCQALGNPENEADPNYTIVFRVRE